jgi:hypothetical protein
MKNDLKFCHQHCRFGKIEPANGFCFFGLHNWAKWYDRAQSCAARSRFIGVLIGNTKAALEPIVR